VAKRITQESEQIRRPIFPKKEHEIGVNDILKKKDEDIEKDTISSTFKRPSMVSQNFVNELTMKLMKKSMGHAGSCIPEESP
jgi:hypothetical protein